MRLFLSVIFFLSFSVVIAQTVISGTVFDGKTNKPLEGVSVYFDGTTFGVITNAKGYFELQVDEKINSVLVVSFLGYSDIAVPDPYDKGNWKIYLKEKAIALEEVTLKADPFTREQKLKAFKTQFLGTNENARSCKILNEDAIGVAYDVTTNQLLASADAPIVIKNEQLGYEHRFTLIDFHVKYSRRTLSTFSILETYYVGTSFFIDKQKEKRKYLRRRKNAYEGSILHLMRTLRDEDYENQKFKFFKGSFEMNPKRYITVDKNNNTAKVTLPKFKIPILFKNKRTNITNRSDHLIIDSYGNFSPPTALFFDGDMGAQRVGDMLPLDYEIKNNINKE